MKKFIIPLALFLIICIPLKSFGQESKRETRRITENFEGPFLTFFEDFNWKMENGEFVYSGGDTTMYHLNKFTDDFYDFTLSTKCTWKGGSKDFAYGIFFREINGGMYAFDITQSGYYRLQRLEDKKWNIITKWTRSSIINNASNELKVTCKGNSIKCFINNKKVIDVVDESLSHGDVGFGVDGNVKCSYDDFKIGPPEDVKEENNSGTITENFNGPSSIFTYDENWKIKNGELAFSSVNSKFGTSYIEDEFSDFTMTTKAKWTGGHQEAGYGFLFRTCKEGGYSFIINQNGEFTLIKNASGNAQQLQPWTHVDFISTGYNELKVTCIGSKINCFINNKKVVSVTDNIYAKGFISYYADPSVECSFDDFSIGSPVEDKGGTTEEIFSEVVKETFDNGTTDFQLNEFWKLEDGALYHSSDNEGCMHWNRISNSFTDCTISVKTKWNGKETNSSFGLRYGDRHCFMIAQDGHYKMNRWTGSEWETLVDWQETDLVSDDYNSLVVTCSGKNIRAYLNNTLVINIIDNSYEGGYVGVVCSCDVEAYFDDFSVVVPNKNLGVNENINTVSEKEETGNEILRDSFDGSTSALRLNQNWKLENGTLSFTNGVARRTYWTFTDDSYSDFSCSINAKWAGRENNLGYGIAFGISGNVTFTFDITQTGYYELSYWDGSKWTNFVAYKKSDLITTGFNNLKVTCKGNRVLCYINNIQVIDTELDNYSSGRLGAFCCGDLDAVFDDFAIYKVD